MEKAKVTDGEKIDLILKPCPKGLNGMKKPKKPQRVFPAVRHTRKI